MDNQAIVDQLMKKLAFEVEAIPKANLTQNTAAASSKPDPLNVKIRVRKKENNEPFNHEILSKDQSGIKIAPQKIRLVNSDETIMSFDVLLEAEFEKKTPRKIRKNIFGLCLGNKNDDDHEQKHDSGYSANIIEGSSTSKSDGILRRQFTLYKNTYAVFGAAVPPKEKTFLGKCKPGGCLDPPFGEDKYSYKPNKEEPILCPQKDLAKVELDEKDTKRKPKDHTHYSKPADDDVDDASSILSLYKVGPTTKNVITYPPHDENIARTRGIVEDKRCSEVKIPKSKRSSEQKSAQSINEPSLNSFFGPPKGVVRVRDDSSDDTEFVKERPNRENLESLVPISVDLTSDHLIKMIDTENISNTNLILGRQIVPVPSDKDVDNKTKYPLDILIPDPCLKTSDQADGISSENIDDSGSQIRDNKLVSQKPLKILDSTCSSLSTSQIKQSFVKQIPDIDNEKPLRSFKLSEMDIVPECNNNHVKLLDETLTFTNTNTGSFGEIETSDSKIDETLTFTNTNTGSFGEIETSDGKIKNQDESMIKARHHHTTKGSLVTVIGTNEPVPRVNEDTENVSTGPLCDKDSQKKDIEDTFYYNQNFTSELINIHQNLDSDKCKNRFNDLEYKINDQNTANDPSEIIICQNSDVNSVRSIFHDLEDETSASYITSKADKIITHPNLVLDECQNTVYQFDENNDDSEKTSRERDDEMDYSQNIASEPDEMISYKNSNLDTFRNVVMELDDKIDNSRRVESEFDEMSLNPISNLDSCQNIFNEPKDKIDVRQIESDSDEIDPHQDQNLERRPDIAENYSFHKDKNQTPSNQTFTGEKTKTDLYNETDERQNVIDEPDKLNHSNDINNRQEVEEIKIDLENQAFDNDSNKSNNKDLGESSPYLTNSLPDDSNGKNKETITDTQKNNEQNHNSDEFFENQNKNEIIQSPNLSENQIYDESDKMEDIKVDIEQELNNQQHTPSEPDKYNTFNKNHVAIHEQITPDFDQLYYQNENVDIPLSNITENNLNDTSLRLYLNNNKNIDQAEADEKVGLRSSDNLLGSVGSDLKKDIIVEMDNRNILIFNNDEKISKTEKSRILKSNDDEILHIQEVQPSDISEHQTSIKVKENEDILAEAEPLSKIGILYKNVDGTGNDYNDADHSTNVSLKKEISKDRLDNSLKISKELNKIIGTPPRKNHVLRESKERVKETDSLNRQISVKSSEPRIILEEGPVKIRNAIKNSFPLTDNQPTSDLNNKQNTVALELAFHSYLNDKNLKILRTVDAKNDIKRYPNDSLTLINSQIDLNSHEINVPVDSTLDMTIKIKKNNDRSKAIQQKNIAKYIPGFQNSSKSPKLQDSLKESKVSSQRVHYEKKTSDDLYNTLSEIYEQELVPLHVTIKNLKEEIDALAAQQTLFKRKVYCIKKNKIPRLVHTNKRCNQCRL